VRRRSFWPCPGFNRLECQGKSYRAPSASRRTGPQSAVFQTNLGYLQFEEKTLEKALNTFRQATLLDERYAPAHFGIATVLQAMEQGIEAEQAARSGLAVDDSDSLGWNVLRLTLKLQNRDEEAEEAFDRSLSLDPELPDPASNLGSLLQQRGEFEKAIAM